MKPNIDMSGMYYLCTEEKLGGWEAFITGLVLLYGFKKNRTEHITSNRPGVARTVLKTALSIN